MAIRLRSSSGFVKIKIRLLILICLFIIPLFLLNSVITKILYTLYLLLAVLFSLIFWTNFVPYFQKYTNNILKFLYALVLGAFQHAPSIYHIQSGRFDKDYFNIQKKPKFSALLLDDASVVVMINNKGEKKILLPGFHFVHFNEKVLHIFNLNPKHFSWEYDQGKPSIRSSISKIKSNIPQSFLAPLVFNRTVYDHVPIPIFSIYYNFSREIDLRKVQETFISLSNYFSEQAIYGEINLQLEMLISASISSVWQVLSAKKVSSERSSDSEFNYSHYEEYIELINTLFKKPLHENSFVLPNNSMIPLPKIFCFLKNLDFLEIKIFLDSLRTVEQSDQTHEN